MESRIADVTEIPSFVTNFFLSLKAFVKSSSKRFCVLIHDTRDTGEFGVLIRETLTGMFVSAAREFESVRFRTVEIGEDKDLAKALATAITSRKAPAQTIWRDDTLFGIQLQELPLDFTDQSAPLIEPGDVIVLSGGARGITSYMARSLSPFGANLVLLGTTQLKEDPELKEMSAGQDQDEKSIQRFVTSKYPNLAANELQMEIARISKSLEINQTLSELKTMGIDATYINCDVTDEYDVKRAFASIRSKSSRIAGIVHGAGIVRDRLLGEMSHDDFSDVVKVKLLGAWNLFRAVDVDTLKFFLGLSSISVFGNPGQVNYSAGNRSMSALINRLSKQHPEILFKSLTLPPIEGAGMADQPDIRELLTMRGIDYLHVHELAELFPREICLSRPRDVMVTFGKKFTDDDSHLLPVSSDSMIDAERNSAGTVTFRKTDFPMIEKVAHTDLRQHQLEAICRYSRKTHPWLEDHTPGQSLKHPFVSGVMALETLMEASRLLYPQFKVRGARDVEFLNLMEVPSNVDRECRIISRRVAYTNEDVVCEASLKAPEISPTGRITERVSMHYRAKIMLGPHLPKELNQVEGLPLLLEDMEAINDDHPLALAWKVADPGLKGRYDGLCTPLAIGSGVVHARSFCRVSEDVVGTSSASYMYSPYVLEALVQTCCRYLLTTRDAGPRWPIPVRIKEVTLTRLCRAGESITIEARVTRREKDEVTWNARAVDQDSQTVMYAGGMVMRLISIT